MMVKSGLAETVCGTLEVPVGSRVVVQPNIKPGYFTIAERGFLHMAGGSEFLPQDKQAFEFRAVNG
ncbi:hypothetical protein ACIGKQ_21045 [Gordonia sp. NPDC062954]|uniref:hypothetical protein n=1 Tax=Gordonia sp. NPDC062954 TaxID=3364003 RepID=UPI0037CA3D82